MPQIDITTQTRDLADGDMTAIELPGGEHRVLVSNIQGTLHAIYGKCSHYGAPLDTGALDGHRVVCPWHHACFDARTGLQLEGPGIDSLPTYEIVARDGKQYLEVPDEISTTCHAPLADRDSDNTDTYIIVGGGPAGVYAAEGMRRGGYTGRIVLVSAEAELPYDRTQASKGYLKGDADDEGMPLKPRSFYQDLGVDLHLGTRATSLDPEARTLTLDSGDTMSYTKILLATGSTARELPVPGGDLEGVQTLRTWSDARQLRRLAKDAGRVVVIGASFIGLEAAQALQAHGCEVTVVAPEALPFAGLFGEDVAEYVAGLHRDAGIALRLPDEAVAIDGSDGRATAVQLKSGDTLPADLVVVGIGVQPATEWLPEQVVGDAGRISVDEQMRHSDTLYAAGDIASFPYRGEQIHIEHWKVAADHGRTAGCAMAGDTDAHYDAAPYFWTAQQGTNLRYLGHAKDATADRSETHGSVPKAAFYREWYEAEQVAAILGVGKDKEMAAMHSRLQ